MVRKATGLRQNVTLLYQTYGGFYSLIRSEYFWISVIFTLSCWRFVVEVKWTEIAFTVLPTLAGFSIAAYAILLVVLDEKSRNALSAPSPELGNRSPLLMLASSISHAVFIQISCILSSVILAARPLPRLQSLSFIRFYIKIISSAFGLFLMMYGIVLVLASIFSIFRLLEIRTRLDK